MPRTIRQHAFGGPENLRIDDLPTPQPGTGEALLRVQAIGLTRDQIPYLAGDDYGARSQPELPARFGYEVAGIVESVGDGVDPSWVGKSVAPVGPWDQARYGAAADYAVVPAARLTEYPGSIDPAQAAALWVPYLTAHCLVSVAGLSEGDVVVIAAASSAVGLAAMEIVRDGGGLPIAATRDPDKADRLRQLGAHDVIVTSTEDYVQRVAEISGGAGARITLDPISGGFLDLAAEAASVHGTIIEYGLLGGIPAAFPLGPVVGKGLTIRGFTLDEIVSDVDSRDRAVAYTLDRVAGGRFTPQVAATYPLEQVHEAFAHVADGPGFGRIVLSTGPTAQLPS